MWITLWGGKITWLQKTCICSAMTICQGDCQAVCYTWHLWYGSMDEEYEIKGDIKGI